MAEVTICSDFGAQENKVYHCFYCFPIYLRLSERMKVKEESENVGLKLNIQKTKIVASSPITSWQIDGGKNAKNGRFYFLGVKNHCGW